MVMSMLAHVRETWQTKKLVATSTILEKMVSGWPEGGLLHRMSKGVARAARRNGANVSRTTARWVKGKVMESESRKAESQWMDCSVAW